MAVEVVHSVCDVSGKWEPEGPREWDIVIQKDVCERPLWTILHQDTHIGGLCTRSHKLTQVWVPQFSAAMEETYSIDNSLNIYCFLPIFYYHYLNKYGRLLVFGYWFKQRSYYGDRQLFIEKYNFLNKSAKEPTRIGQANESVLKTRKQKQQRFV